MPSRPSRDVLVTGGGGFIGSHLVDLLLASGDRVTVIDSFVTSTRRNLAHVDDPALRVVRADVRERVDGSFDRIYHLASPASPVDYDEDPLLTLTTNAIGTRNALELAARTPARFLLASTSEIYGDPEEHPQRERYRGNVDPIGPRSAYDEAKRFAEALTVAYVRARGVNGRIVRIFNTYGPRMRMEDGRMPSAFIVAALRGDPIPVHGTGRQTRSLCFASDTVRGLRAAMERGRKGEAYNIGRPDEVSVAAFAKMVLAMANSRSVIRRVPGREGDIHRRKPDITKARRELGWSPKVPLDEGLRATIDWYAREIQRVRS